MTRNEITEALKVLNLVPLHSWTMSSGYNIYDCGNRSYGISPAYVGTFEMLHGRLYFNGKCYGNRITEMLDAIRDFNNTREWPAYYYDPNARRSYITSCIIGNYLKLLGFEYPTFDEMWNNGMNSTSTTYFVRHDIYGEIKRTLMLYIDDDNAEAGRIVIPIGRYSWVESKFNNLHEAFAAINSLLEPELLIDAANNIKAVSEMTSDRQYDNVYTKYADLNTMTIYTAKLKDALKPMLENAVKILGD